MAEGEFDSWRVDYADRVQDLPADTHLGKVATPIIYRAEQLCDALDEAGEHRPDRNFLAAAIIATTEADVDDLVTRLKTYRLAKVHDVVIGATETQGEVALERPRRS
jgi:hypothetical protein